MQRRNAAGRENTKSSGERVDVAIVGAGPAGLAAALSARAEGAGSILVVERLNDYSRRRSVILDSEVLMLLEEWGVSLDGVSSVDTFSYIHGYGKTQLTESMPFPRFDSGQSKLRERIQPRPNDILFNRLPRAVQSINELERTMLAEAREQGIDVRFDARVTNKPAIRPDYVRLEYEGRERANVIDCDYLVVADGARSSVNRLLGNERLPCTLRSHEYACSVFESPRRDVMLFWVPRHPSGITEITGLGNGSRYTLVSRVPDCLRAAGKTITDDSRLAAMIRKAAESIGLRGPIIDGPMRFNTEMDRLREVAIHPRVLCVGDAARRGDPGFGGNLNEAIRDGRRFGTYFRSALRSDHDREVALRAFRHDVQGATTALQTGGALTNNLRDFFAFGNMAQAFLPGPARSILHFDVGVMMKATGAIVKLLNSSMPARQDKF